MDANFIVCVEVCILADLMPYRGEYDGRTTATVFTGPPCMLTLPAQTLAISAALLVFSSLSGLVLRATYDSWAVWLTFGVPIILACSIPRFHGSKIEDERVPHLLIELVWTWIGFVVGCANVSPKPDVLDLSMIAFFGLIVTAPVVLVMAWR